MTVVLTREWLEIEYTVFSVLILLILGRVVTPEEAFGGFANIGVLTIGILFIVAGAMRTTGLLELLNAVIYGSKKTGIVLRLLRLMIPVTAISAFINNTPIVAILIPSIRSWAQKNRKPLSKLLIPLSYAAIFGGNLLGGGNDPTNPNGLAILFFR